MPLKDTLPAAFLISNVSICFRVSCAGFNAATRRTCFHFCTRGVKCRVSAAARAAAAQPGRVRAARVRCPRARAAPGPRPGPRAKLRPGRGGARAAARAIGCAARDPRGRAVRAALAQPVARAGPGAGAGAGMEARRPRPWGECGGGSPRGRGSPRPGRARVGGEAVSRVKRKKKKRQPLSPRKAKRKTRKPGVRERAFARRGGEPRSRGDGRARRGAAAGGSERSAPRRPEAQSPAQPLRGLRGREEREEGERRRAGVSVRAEPWRCSSRGGEALPAGGTGPALLGTGGGGASAAAARGTRGWAAGGSARGAALRPQRALGSADFSQIDLTSQRGAWVRDLT